MRVSLLLPLVAVVGLMAAGCVENPPPPPGPELCQPGTYSATGEAPCDPAPAGSYVDTVGATFATLCEPGTYQDLQGQISCVDAAPGTFVATAGASSSTQCPLGRFQPNAGSIECLLAPIGTYVDTTGSPVAFSCPPGTTTLFEGATSESDCVMAP